MPAPNFIQARATTLAVSISAAETTEIKLKNLVDAYGNNLSMSNFGTTGYITIDPGSTSEEIVSFTGFTTNSDNTVSIDTGITRALVAVSPYGSGGTASAHSAGARVVVSNNPQTYDAIIDYIDGIAIAGGSDASTTAKGFFEAATVAETDADTATGSTGALLAIDPATLASSKYGTNIPSSTQKDFLNFVSGSIQMYAGSSAPTGFLLCDGSSYDIASYTTLHPVLLGKYGLDNATTFTADNTTNTYTATSHGLSDDDVVYVDSSASDLPNGLIANTIYYVISSTTNTFQLSTSSGGSAVAISDDGTGTHSFYTQFKVPDLRSRFPLGFGAAAPTLTFDFTDSDVNTGTDVITVDSNDTLHTGQAVALTSSGTVPTGLSETTYYVIRASATTIKLATSVDLANEGTQVDITAASGGGTHTLTWTMTQRDFATVGGTETMTEVPTHHHGLPGSVPISGSASSGWSSASQRTYVDYTLSVGGDSPNNMPPYVTVNYIIKT